MTDLKERLRTEYARNGGQGAYAWRSRELCGQAAARIETLEAALRRIEGMQDGEQAWFARDIARTALFPLDTPSM